jgi:hypothetical protein
MPWWSVRVTSSWWGSPGACTTASPDACRAISRSSTRGILCSRTDPAQSSAAGRQRPAPSPPVAEEEQDRRGDEDRLTRHHDDTEDHRHGEAGDCGSAPDGHWQQGDEGTAHASNQQRRYRQAWHLLRFGLQLNLGLPTASTSRAAAVLRRVARARSRAAALATRSRPAQILARSGPCTCSRSDGPSFTIAQRQ